MRNIVLIQHTQAEHHINNMVGGDTDWSLTDHGKEQAKNIGINLKEALGDIKYKIYSSDMTRTKQTAEIINEYLNFEIAFRAELRERREGAAKGKSAEWKRNNSASKGDTSFMYYRTFPDAESFEDIYNRLQPFINEIDRNSENIIIVGHGFSFRMLILHLLKIPLEMGERLIIEASPGGVSFLTENDEKVRMLNVWNDKSQMK